MKLFSLLTAILVSGFLYLAVFERPRLLAFAGREAPAAQRGSPQTPAPISAPISTQIPIRKSPPESAPVPVVALRSKAQNIDDAVVLRGQTEPSRRVELRAETAGRVISEPGRKGAAVATGEVLCRIDPGARPARLAEAGARLSEAEINAKAAAKLSTAGYASDTRLAAATAALQSARAGVAAAKAEISRLEIKAPFAGLLEGDTAELGSLLQPGALCATIVQLDPIRLVGFVPATDIARITPGARAGGRLTTGQDVVGRVGFLARQSDPLTRTFRVEIKVANPDLALRAGQSAQILIQSAGKSAHLVPQSALTLNDDGVLGVRIIDGSGRARFAPVTLLRDSRAGAWLTGLPEKVDVIVSGQEYVTDGVPVVATFQGPGG